MFQVEVISKKTASGGTVAVHRYMAAGSCMGVEVWQGPGLLGAPLEQQLTSLVSAVTYIQLSYIILYNCCEIYNYHCIIII